MSGREKRGAWGRRRQRGARKIAGAPRMGLRERAAWWASDSATMCAKARAETYEPKITGVAGNDCSEGLLESKAHRWTAHIIVAPQHPSARLEQKPRKICARCAHSRYATPNLTACKKSPGLRRPCSEKVAEREGFEPSIEFPLCSFSKAVPSATRPSLRGERLAKAREE